MAVQARALSNPTLRCLLELLAPEGGTQDFGEAGYLKMLFLKGVQAV